MATAQSRVTDMTRGDPVRLLLNFSAPLFLSNLLQQFYNLADTALAGHILGDAALAEIRATAALYGLIMNFAFGMNNGLALTVSRLFGAGDEKGVRRATAWMLALAGATAAVLTVVFVGVRRPLLVLLQVPEASIDGALAYLTLILLGIPLTMAYNMEAALLRAIGNSLTPLYFLLFSTVLNIGLDPLLIFGFHMGVKGAAWATVISQACSAVWIIGFLTSNRASLRLQPRHMRWDGAIVRSILALGVSPFIMASTESLIGFVLNSSLKAYGDIYISALAIMQSAMLFVSVPLTGFAQGFVPVASYNYGHGNRERLKSCFRIVLLTMFTFNLVLIMLMLCFPHLVAAAFTDDGRLIATVERVMPLFLSGMSIFGLQRACQNAFVALGAARISVFIALLRKVFLLVPLALLLPHFWGIKGVFLAESISDATAAICCTLIFAYQFPRILAHMKTPKAA